MPAPMPNVPNRRGQVSDAEWRQRVDLAALLQREEGATAGKDYALVLPASLDLDLRAQVQELVFERFTATDISGTIRLKDRVLRVEPMAFNTADGAVLGSLQLDGRGGAGASAYPLAIEATIKDIDVKQLFHEFQDFGQDFIGERHLSGRTRASIASGTSSSAAKSISASIQARASSRRARQPW